MKRKYSAEVKVNSELIGVVYANSKSELHKKSHIFAEDWNKNRLNNILRKEKIEKIQNIQ